MISFIRLILLWIFTVSLTFSFAQTIFINDIPLDFKKLSFSVMPGDTTYIISKSDQEISLMNKDKETYYFVHSYHLIAPEKTGIYNYQLKSDGINYQINLLVMKSLKGIENTYPHFKIGHYPTTPYKNLPQYLAPEGMIEVTKENENTFVSEHFKIKDFLVKQKSDYPKYVLIDIKLIYKLELIHQELEKAGYKNLHIHVMSGYRTPYYNSKIGNGKYSRHIYGDAADIFIDSDHSGAMDDINKDGIINKADAKELATIIKKIDHNASYKWLIGGLGIYGPNSAHQGFVHVDTRGFKARW